MLKVLDELLKEKSVLILGFGKEGKSTYKLLTRLNLCKKIDLADIKVHDDYDKARTNVHFGDHYLDHLDSYDVVFKSPGIILPKDLSQYNCIITSQTEVFLRAYNRQVIGVTGTKGKSTVTSLLYHVLHKNGISSLLAGNIGTPVFEIIDYIEDKTIVILELSCHQLQYCMYSPSIAVFLNLYEDHLDFYGSFDKYRDAKKNIYLHQHPLDSLFYGDNIVLDRREFFSRIFSIETNNLPFESLESIENNLLRGKHNMINAAFVYEIARSFDISDEEFIGSLQSFTPLRHRLEYLGKIDGVDYYDDSISTAVESTISAVNSIENVSTIIIGGMDRGINYTPLIDFLLASKVNNIILMYESGKKLYDMFLGREVKRNDLNIVYETDLNAASKTAKKLTPSGRACILSPASASYTHFKNFEERGNVYRKILFGDD